MRVKVRFRTNGASETICILSRIVPTISSTAIHYSQIVSTRRSSSSKRIYDRNRDMNPIIFNQTSRQRSARGRGGDY